MNLFASGFTSAALMDLSRIRAHWKTESVVRSKRALQQKYGKEPLVDLEDPDVSVVAEVLGPWTAIGISKKVWRQTKMEMPERRVS
jgi:hypothetical protein